MGHHIKEGRFESDLHPELAPDKIILSFKDQRAWRALAVLAQSYEVVEPELAADIRERLRTIRGETA